MRNYILGGAQLGQGYGHFVRSTTLSLENLSGLMSFALLEGINEIDGAQNYSSMFENIARVDVSDKFLIATKIEYKLAEEAKILCDLKLTLSVLRSRSFSFLLIHNWHKLNDQNKQHAINFLNKLKNDGICLKIGISVYEVSEIESYCKSLDIIQAPLNFFNMSFLLDSLVLELHEGGLEFHARGIFHQGTLLNSSKASDMFPREFSKFEKYCERKGFSKIQAALSIYDGQKIFSRLIIGVNCKEQLSSILEAPIALGTISPDLLSSSYEPSLVDPRRWGEVK